MPFATLKTAVVAPMPSASVRVAAAVKARPLRIDLAAYRRSWCAACSHPYPHIPRVTSMESATLPNSRRAPISAVSGLSPASTRCFTSMAIWAAISSSSSCSRAGRRKGQGTFLPPFGGPHDARNGSHYRVPFRLLARQLTFAGGGEFVVFGPAVGFRLLPLRSQPSLLLQSVQRGVQRAVLNL